MGKAKADTSSFRQELFQFGLYKRNQGRIARQVTFVTMAVTTGLGVLGLQGVLEYSVGFKWLLGTVELARSQAMLSWAVPTGIFCLGIWLSYRVVNWPKFADFLIAVEAEMNKVYWPSRSVLFRSSMVVLFVIFFLGILLFVYDTFWKLVFHQIGID